MSESSDDQFGNPADGIERDAEGDWQVVAQTHYDPGASDGLTATILFAIADVEGVDPVDLNSPVLYDCIDVAALEKGLFGSMRERDEEGSVQFAFGEYRVSVRSDGWVLVSERS